MQVTAFFSFTRKLLDSLWRHPIIIGFLLLAFILALPLHLSEVERHEPDPTLAIITYGATTVSQTFIPTHRWVTWMEFTLGDLEKVPLDTVMSFTLRPLTSDRVLHQTVQPLSEMLRDEHMLHVSFSPFLTRPGEQYKSTLGIAEAKVLPRVPLLYQQADEYYPAGNVWIKEHSKKGDLGFRLGAYRPLWYVVAPHFTFLSPWWKWILVICIGLVAKRIVRQSQYESTVSATEPKTRDFYIHFGVLLLVTLSLSVWAYIQGSLAFYDAAHDGLETIEEVLHGNIQPFYEHYTGHQPLMDWILAVLFLTIGMNTLTLHAVGIGAHVLTVALAVLVARRLWNPLTGWYAGWLAAGSHWLLLTMHEGTRVVLIPPLMLVALLGMLKISESRSARSRIGWALLGGLAVGALGYVYAVGWIVIMAYVVALVGWWVWSYYTKAAPVFGSTMLFMALVILLTLLPLLQYAYENPERVLERPQSLVAEQSGQGMFDHIQKGLVPTATAFLYLPLGPWSDNARLLVADLPVHFPVPLVAPGMAMLLVAALIMSVRSMRRYGLRSAVVWLWLLFFFCWLPSLIVTDPHPHFRRIFAAIVPLLLLVAWSSTNIHIWVRQRGKLWVSGWIVFLGLALLYGPAMFFAYALPSAWYSAFYFPQYDTLSARIFPYLDAGHTMAVVGNGAHLKSLQFYALASPYGKQAFTLMDVPTSHEVPASQVVDFDVVVVAHPDCQAIVVPGFLPTPVLVESKFNVIGCIYQKQEDTTLALTTEPYLPKSGPLWRAAWAKLPPFDVHRPFRGPIFKR